MRQRDSMTGNADARQGRGRLTVRPHRVFLLHETAQDADRLVSFVLPTDRTPRLLETAVLVALTKALAARHIFEIGTLYGLQTLNLAANLPADGHLWTLDLDRAALAEARLNERDRAIAARHLAAAHEPAFAAEPWPARVTQLWGDSTRFDYSDHAGRMNLVYVDGGHDLATVTSDTRHALRLLDDSRPGAVVWHDDQNPAHPDVAVHLDQVAQEREIFYVGDTWLAIAFNAAAAPLAEKLR